MKWEYFRLATVEASLDESLRELGEDGWELVSVVGETRLFHGFQCLFKRPFTGKAPSNRLTTSPAQRFPVNLRSNVPPLPARTGLKG